MESMLHWSMTMKPLRMPLRNDAPIFQFCTLLFLISVSMLLNSVSASTVLSQEVRQCPCDFIVRTGLEEGPIHLVLTAARGGRPQLSSALHRFSRFNQTTRGAYRRRAEYAYHRVWVPVRGRVRLSVHSVPSVHPLHGPQRTAVAPYILPDKRISDVCPDLISDDRPDLSRFAATRIVGGRPANKRLAKSLAFLYAEVVKDGQVTSAVCSGTLIGPHTIVTAAHCKTGGKTVAAVGETEIVRGVTLYEVESFTVHPRYSDDISESVQFDIAIVNLAKNVSEQFKPVKYNKNDTVPESSALVRSVGYGVTAQDGGDFGTLLQVDLIAMSDRECEDRHVRVDVELDSDRILCAGRPERNGCGIWYVSF